LNIRNAVDTAILDRADRAAQLEYEVVRGIKITDVTVAARAKIGL